MFPLPGFEYCRICGYQPDHLPYGEDGLGASYEICSSCGNEFGLTDRYDDQIQDRRQLWLKSGPAWYSKLETCPTDWQPLTQLQQVPDHFRFPDENCWADEDDLETISEES